MGFVIALGPAVKIIIPLNLVRFGGHPSLLRHRMMPHEMRQKRYADYLLSNYLRLLCLATPNYSLAKIVLCQGVVLTNVISADGYFTVKTDPK